MQAIHGVFSPCIYMNHKFVDGGIIDNVPAGEVRKLGVDKVLTIKFANDLESDPKGIFEIVFKSIDLLFILFFDFCLLKYFLYFIELLLLKLIEFVDNLLSC